MSLDLLRSRVRPDRALQNTLSSLRSIEHGCTCKSASKRLAASAVSNLISARSARNSVSAKYIIPPPNLTLELKTATPWPLMILSSSSEGAEDCGVECGRILQHGKVANIGQNDQARCWNHPCHIDIMGLLNTLVILPIRDGRRHADPPELVVRKVGLSGPHVTDLIQKCIVLIRRPRKLPVLVAAALDKRSKYRRPIKALDQARRVRIRAKHEHPMQSFWMARIRPRRA